MILRENPAKIIYFTKLIQYSPDRVLLFRSNCIMAQIKYYIITNVYFLV